MVVCSALLCGFPWSIEEEGYKAPELMMLPMESETPPYVNYMQYTQGGMQNHDPNVIMPSAAQASSSNTVQAAGPSTPAA